MKALIRILVLLALLLLVSAVNAQFSLGLRGGVNLAKADWNIPELNMPAEDLQDNLDMVVMPYFALIGEFGVSQHFAVQIEPSFLQQGVRMAAQENEEPYLMDFDTRWEFDYLTLPVLGKGIFGNEAVRGFVVIGPQVGYAIDGRVRAEFTLTNGETLTEKETMDIDWAESELSRWDFGLMLGGGIELKAGPGAILVDARYLLGLSNLNTNEAYSDKIYQRGIGLTAGYLIPIGK